MRLVTSFTLQERTGWFSTQAFEKIKTVLRYKWNSLQMGYIPTREECERQLAAPEHKPFYGSRPTKHNMAKGAQRPEDEMVSSLKMLPHNSTLSTRSLGQETTGASKGAGEGRRHRVIAHSFVQCTALQHAPIRSHVCRPCAIRGILHVFLAFYTN